jgi:hydroxyethylthiazole kinase-like uncharacterized protein yjeF
MAAVQDRTQDRRDRSWIDSIVVTAAQMAAIEARLFEAGMPVAALMEKVAGRIAQRIQALYPMETHPRWGIVVGPGHNGGDAWVVARELWCQGYDVRVYQPFSKGKDLTYAHRRYGESLGIPIVAELDDLHTCTMLLDGLFGFGLTRPLEGAIAAVVDQINRWQMPVVSIDLPSGLQTDTGAVLGTAVRATHTLCLGLWKAACLQDDALPYLGRVERIDFDIPRSAIQAVVGDGPPLRRITCQTAIAALPPPVITTHKYQQGHLLLVAGSRTYAGAVVLAAWGARASGAGMVSVAVPASLHLFVVAQVPEAVVIPCPETEDGAIAHLPDLDLRRYDAIACGPGLGLGATAVVQSLLAAPCPLVLDADGLTLLAAAGQVEHLSSRSQPTVLTPHGGEFKRLFPTIDPALDRLTRVQQAAQHSGALVLLKGARVAIASPDQVWINPHSTPALARGGSGDVLTGLAGGILSQTAPQPEPTLRAIAAAAWWHAQAGCVAADQRSARGVDATTLSQWLVPALAPHLQT